MKKLVEVEEDKVILEKVVASKAKSLEHKTLSKSLEESVEFLEEVETAIVIPTLNEVKSIRTVLDEIAKVLNGSKFAVVVVDGHSTDGTDEVARSKGAQVIYQRNKGYGDALRTGFQYVRKSLNAKIIIMMDADLTYDPNDIPKLVKPILKDEADLVLGNRFVRMNKEAMPFINRIGNKMISWFARTMLKVKVHDTQCGLRGFRSELVDSIDFESDGMPLAIEMLVEAKFLGARISEVPVAYRERVGCTKLNPLKDGMRILGTMIRLMRDTQPLLFFGGIGVFLGVIGLVLGIEVTLEWLKTGTIGRIPTVMLSVLLMVSSMQFFTLGLVADMIKRLRRNVCSTYKHEF